jgi:hypothetical protein
MPIQRSTITLSFLPLPIRDWIGRRVSRLTFGDLEALGMPKAQEGPVSQVVKHGRIPLIDVGTVELVRQKKIRLRPNLQQFERDGIRFVDGALQPFDAVVLATGYDVGVSALSSDLRAVTDQVGCPRDLHHADLPGLFFVGYSTPPTGLLRQIAIDARRVAKRIIATRPPPEPARLLAANG